MGIQDSFLVVDLRTQYLELLLLMSNVKPRVGITDKFLWPLVQNNSFSVKSRYEFIQKTVGFELLEITLNTALEII